MPTSPPVPQQTPVPTPPPAPAPVIAGGGGGGAPVVSLPGVPQTVQQLTALRLRGDELSRQLNSARNRRDMLARRLDRGDVDAQGLQQQVGFLDARILKLEQAIDENGQLIANAAPGVLVQTSSRFPINDFPRPRMDPTPIFIVFILFVLAPVAFGFVWRSLRRTAAPTLPHGWNEHLQRMERLEQAVDTIAIEIERISEGQRFLTKTLADRTPGADAAHRAPQPVAVPAAGEMPGPRALGAGAMNGVPMAQREGIEEQVGASGRQ